MVTTHKTHRRRGIVLIELALVLPLLVLLVFGLMEYAWAFMSALEMKNAARSAVRIGVAADSVAGDVTTAVTTYMNAAGMGGSGYSVTVSADPTTLGLGEPLTVTITVPYPNVSLLNMAIIPTPTMLQASMTMAKEGP